MDTLVNQLPFGNSDNLSELLINLISLLMFMVFVFYGGRIQLYNSLYQIRKSLNKLDVARQAARSKVIQSVRDMGKPTENPEQRIDQLMEYSIIEPTSMDPVGIVSKLEHLLDTYDDELKGSIRTVAPQADEVQLNNLSNLFEAAYALDILYKVVRHFYLYGRKTKSPYVIMQLQMVLPLLMESADAFSGALTAFSEGQPIGDGAGALVAAKLIGENAQLRKIAEDTIVAETKIEGRRAFVLKAQGPGGNVGKPGEGVRALLEETQGKVRLVVMIDGGLKLEGEKTGEIVEGVGAAIGGPGVDKFKIEETASKYKIPVYAVVLKESNKEALTQMKKEIADSAERAIAVVKRIVTQFTADGDTVIVAGIGNTIGIKP